MAYNEDEVIVYRTAIKILQYLSLFPQNGGSINFKLYMKFIIPLLIIGLPNSIGVIGYIYQAYLNKNLDAFLYVAYYVNMMVMGHTIVILFVIKGNKEIIPLFEMMSQMNVGLQQVYREEIEYINVFTKRVLFYYISLVTFTTIESYMNDKFCNDEKLLDDQHYICGLVMTLWYPIEINEKMKPIFAVSTSVLFYYQVPLISVLVSFYKAYGLIRVRIEHVIKLLKQLEFHREGTEETKSKLLHCGESYNELICLLRKMNETLGVLLAPAHNAYNTLLIGICGYLMIKFHSSAFVVHLYMWIFIQGMICYCGQQLEDAQLTLQHELYNTQWYDLSPSLRSTFKIFQTEVSMPLHMKIQPLHVMNMNHFAEIIRGTYTFFMFLLRI